MKSISIKTSSEQFESVTYQYNCTCMTKTVGLKVTSLKITDNQYCRLESIKEDDWESVAPVLFEEITNEINKLCMRIITACKVPPRAGRAHRRAIDFLLTTLWQTFERFSSTKEPTLVQLAEYLASLGDDYGSNGEIGGITVYLKGGREYLDLNTEGTWLTVNTLLEIIEDSGDVPVWWQYGWTVVRKNNEWVAREVL